MSDTRMAMAQRTLNGVLAITGGLLLAVSAFRPWIRSTPGLEADPTRPMDTVSGMDGGDGIFFLAGGVLIAALGLLTTLSRPRAAPILLILNGLAFGLFGLLEYNSIRDSIRATLSTVATWVASRWEWASGGSTPGPQRPSLLASSSSGR
jgi:hypothetical protein